MAKICSDNFVFSIDVTSMDLEQGAKGNPYNSTCDIQVISDEFSGKTEITTSIKNIINFVNELKSMYDTFKGKATLVDFDFGTKINVECDYRGYFIFEGVLINQSFQKLQFKNSIDQTYLSDFIRDLSLQIE